MLIKQICLILAATQISFANIENVEFLADQVEKDENLIKARGNVVLHSQNYLVTSDSAIYDQNAQTIDFIGNVTAMRGLGAARSKRAKIDLQENIIRANSAFAMDQNQEIWIISEDSCSWDLEYKTTNSIVSSCNVQNPDWSIKYSSGELSKTSKFMHLYNPVFYVGQVPVMYLPYFGFSTDKTRRSGLLTPEVGYGSSNGLFYRQPIYVAEFDEWDLQFDPQIRTNRSAGVFGIFRFADSPNSHGSLGYGVFSEKKSYSQKEDLKNRTHDGLEIEYDRDKLAQHLLKGDYIEGLWLKFITLSDVDYLNLKKAKNDEDTDSLVQSKLNYFAANGERYGGIYAKYYLDLTKIATPYGNDTTLQELPALQYHEFLSTILTNNFTYSFDAKAHNYTRNRGVRARWYEFGAPVGFNFMLGGVNLSLGENFYASHATYDKNSPSYGGKHDDYIRHYHEFTLQSDLARAYSTFFHTINFKFTYAKPGYKRGNIEKKIKSDDYLLEEDNFIAGAGENYNKRNAASSFVQFFYDEKGVKRIRHSASQDYNFENHEFGDLKHGLNLYFGSFGLYNYFVYSDKFRDFTKSQTGLAAEFGALGLNLSHNYLKDFKAKDLFSRSNSLYARATLDLPLQYQIFASADYDRENKYVKMWKTGLNHHRKCWNYSFVYRKDVEPKSTSAGPGSKHVRGFYFMVAFYPLGGLDYDYSVESDNNGKV